MEQLPGAGTRSVLVAIPDPARAGNLAASFASADFRPTLAFTTDQARRSADANGFVLVIVGADLPGEPPAVLADAIRRSTDAALVLVGDPGLSFAELVAAGFHAQVPPTATPEEVSARARALLGLRPESGAKVSDLAWGSLQLDLARRQALWKGEPVHLTSIQLKLLTALVLARGAVVSRDELHRFVWHSAPVDDGERIVAHVRRIRAKLEVNPSAPRFLLTARGEGFRLADPEPPVRTDSDSSAPLARTADRRSRNRRRSAVPVPVDRRRAERRRGDRRADLVGSAPSER